MSVQAYVTRTDLTQILRDFKTRIRVLEAAVSAAPAEHSAVWVSDGTDMATLVASPSITLRGYKLSNAGSLGAWVAFYDTDNFAAIDDETVPVEMIRIPPRLTANLDGAGVANYETGLCFALWSELDPAAVPDLDFDGNPDAAQLGISLAWDGGE